MLAKRLLVICFLVLLSGLVVPSFAHAYLDPGTGSYVFQLLIASLAGFLFAVAAYRKRVKAFLTRLFSRKRKAVSEDNEPDDDA